MGEIRLLLGFAIAQLLPEWELEHLAKLADPDLPLSMTRPKGNLRGELEHLSKLDLISVQPHSIAEIPDRGDDLKQWIKLTKLGKHYISVIKDSLEKTEEETEISSS
ncbi:MAG: hypothetical protein HC770_09605 [Pseudanabaena sp. CRU_2_10]|nr:hypothetical protein [Pseudanabaena sp. CRU_2_10]